MWEKIKQYGLAVMAIAAWILTAVIFKLKGKNNALQQQLANAKAEEVSAEAAGLAAQQQQKADDAAASFDSLADAYNKSHPGGQSGDGKG